MFEEPAGLVYQPLGVRVRAKALGPATALATRREPFGAIELLFSDLGERFLAGSVKQVANMVNANERSVFVSYSIVGALPAEATARAIEHRRLLRDELAAQYRHAVVRAAAPNARNAKRMRERLNKQLGSARDDPREVGAAMSAYPDALAFAAGILGLWQRLAA